MSAARQPAAWLSLCLLLVSLLGGPVPLARAGWAQSAAGNAPALTNAQIVLCTPSGMFVVDSDGGMIPLDSEERAPLCPDCTGSITGFAPVATIGAAPWPRPPRYQIHHRAEPPMGPRRLASNAVPRAPPPAFPQA